MAQKKKHPTKIREALHMATSEYNAASLTPFQYAVRSAQEIQRCQQQLALTIGLTDDGFTQVEEVTREAIRIAQESTASNITVTCNILQDITRARMRGDVRSPLEIFKAKYRPEK